MARCSFKYVENTNEDKASEKDNRENSGKKSACLQTDFKSDKSAMVPQTNEQSIPSIIDSPTKNTEYMSPQILKPKKTRNQYQPLKTTSGNHFLETQFPTDTNIRPSKPPENKEKKRPAAKNPVIQSNPSQENHLKYIKSILSVRDEALKTKRKTEKELNEELNLHGGRKTTQNLPVSREQL